MASLRGELTSIQCGSQQSRSWGPGAVNSEGLCPGGELEDKHGWMKEVCHAVDTSYSEACDTSCEARIQQKKCPAGVSSANGFSCTRHGDCRG